MPDTTKGNCSVEDGGSGYFQRSGRKGDAGRGPEEDGIPRAHAAAVVHQVREDHTGATTEARYLVDQNCAARSVEVDGSRLVQGVQFSHPRRGHGNAKREICGR